MSTGKLKSAKQGDKQLVFTREFDAPRDLLVKAYTQPEYVRRWLLGPPGWTMPVCEMDVRPGGSYRWEWAREAKVSQMGVSGEYLEVNLPQSLVVTQRFDDHWDGKETRLLVEFLEQGSKTVLKLTITYESESALAAAMQTPMEMGMEMGYERLEKLLAGDEGKAK